MATIVRPEIGDASAPTGRVEGSLDARAGGMVLGASWALVGRAVRAAEYFPLAMAQIRQRSDDARMQWHTTRLAVLRFGKCDVRAPQVDIAPIEPKRFARARAGIEQEYQKRLQMSSRGGDELVNLLDRDPSHALGAGPRALDQRPCAPAAPRGMVQDCGGRCIELAIARCWGRI